MLLTGGLLLCSAFAWAQNAPAAPAAPAQEPAQEEEEPERLEERAYVRKFSLGYSINLTPFNLLPKRNEIEKLTTTPPVENQASVDPESNRFGISFTAQVAVADRWAVAIAPAYRTVKFHGFIRSFSGVDNSSTFIDERAKTEINEDTTAKYLDIPILLRRYSKSRFESGPRWFYEAGGVIRRTSNVKTAYDIVPPVGDRYQTSGALDYKSSTTGITAGIGGQFIDDFGIRAVPEVRYTYWFGRPFDSVHGRSRTHQIEIVLTFAF